MEPDVAIDIMGGDLCLWRCLHGGAITPENIDRCDTSGPVPWAAIRSRNVPLIENLNEVYGACAVVARQGGAIVGILRFYPKAVCEMEGAGAMCLQQVYPAGPAPGFHRLRFPKRDDLADRTLVVHCLTVGDPGRSDSPFQRKGIGTGLVCRLVDWARSEGWSSIEATAYLDLPTIYAVTGQAGLAFWSKLGFSVVETGTEAALDAENAEDFARLLREEAVEHGLDPAAVSTKYTMCLDLA